MLESRANRELCRNGLPGNRRVRYSNKKSLELRAHSIFVYLYPCSIKRDKGIFMVEAAPQLIYEELLQPMVVEVPKMHEDLMVRYRAEAFIRSVGSVALQEKLPEDNYSSSLMESISLAHEGDSTARQMIETNVRTDVVERTIKTGHITSVDLELNEQGKIMQFGQTMESVYANSLRFTPETSKMTKRFEAEARNGMRIENLNRQGLLEDYNFVVFSMAADDMSHQEMQEAGFFTDTMSCSIQVTSTSSEGLKTESAFVSGVDRANGERHDKQTIASLGEALGVDYDQKSSAEIIDTPILVHKSLMPNGVVDLVKHYDDAAGGKFFGETRAREDYLDYSEKCAAREVEFADKVQIITNELISQAGTIWSPVEATKRLNKTSEKHMVTLAIADNSIDARVFGTVAADHIEEARRAILDGNYDAAIGLEKKAQSTARSSSCPSGSSQQEEKQSTSEKKGGKQKMKCPFCKDPNQYGDPCSDSQHCTSCKATVKGGKVVSTGNGGKKK